MPGAPVQIQHPPSLTWRARQGAGALHLQVHGLLHCCCGGCSAWAPRTRVPSPLQLLALAALLLSAGAARQQDGIPGWRAARASVPAAGGLLHRSGGRGEHGGAGVWGLCCPGPRWCSRGRARAALVPAEAGGGRWHGSGAAKVAGPRLPRGSGGGCRGGGCACLWVLLCEALAPPSLPSLRLLGPRVEQTHPSRRR
jgi:hypothetical protein